MAKGIHRMSYLDGDYVQIMYYSSELSPENSLEDNEVKENIYLYPDNKGHEVKSQSSNIYVCKCKCDGDSLKVNSISVGL